MSNSNNYANDVVWYKQTDLIDDVENQGTYYQLPKENLKKKKGCFQCNKCCKWFLLISFIFFAGSSIFTYFFLFQGMSAGAGAEIEFIIPDYEYELDVEETIVTSYEVKTSNSSLSGPADSDVIAIGIAQQTNNTDIVEIIEEVDVEIEVKPHLMADLAHFVMVETYDVPVDILYAAVVGDDMVFVESNMNNQQSYDMHFGEWEQGTDKLKGQMVREIDYKVKTANILITKGYIQVKTKQVLYRSSESGLRYIVDGFNQMDGLPFADSFYSVTRNSFRALSPNKSELRISAEIRYFGNPWKFMKDMLEKNVYSEFDIQYADLSEDLKVYFAQL